MPENLITFPTHGVVLNLEQAAALLQVHPRTVTKMAVAGELPAFRCGRLWRFSASRLRLWIEEASVYSSVAA
jgi:excisionase family DNA binding protein